MMCKKSTPTCYEREICQLLSNDTMYDFATMSLLHERLHNCMLGIYFNFKLQNPRGQCARYVKKGLREFQKFQNSHELVPKM